MLVALLVFHGLINLCVFLCSPVLWLGLVRSLVWLYTNLLVGWLIPACVCVCLCVFVCVSVSVCVWLSHRLVACCMVDKFMLLYSHGVLMYF